MHSSLQLPAAFDDFAARTLQAVGDTGDESFHAEFRFLFNGRVVFSGSRYTAYRINTLDHIIHHCAQ